ncbi:MAG: 50S ribosomal protein L1 [Parcubacteria group bacterium]
MRSKRYAKISKLIDKAKLYPVAEALELLKKNPGAKFDETIEIHFRLGVDPKKGEQQVRGTVVLPFCFGKSKKVAAFVPEARATEAKDAGADIVYTETSVAELQKSGKIEFDILVAVPEMMRAIGPLAKTLGPKGLMPSPKNETISPNLKKMIQELKQGKVAFKNDDTANIHQTIGKVSTDSSKLVANYEALVAAIKKAKPETAKGNYIKNIFLSTTMGPSVKIAL